MSNGELLDTSLKRKRELDQARSSIWWLSFNITIALIIWTDWFGGHRWFTSSRILLMVELIVGTITVLNIIGLLVDYINRVRTPVIVLSPDQKRLLGVTETDPDFPDSSSVTSTPKPKKQNLDIRQFNVIHTSPATTPTNTPMTPVNMSANSWMSSSPRQENISMSSWLSPNSTLQSLSPTSWLSSSNTQQNVSPNSWMSSSATQQNGSTNNSWRESIVAPNNFQMQSNEMLNMSSNSWNTTPEHLGFISMSMSRNESVKSSSWVFHQGSPHSIQLNTINLNNSNIVSPSAVSTRRRVRTAPPRPLFFEETSDKQALQKSLNEIYRKEKQLINESCSQPSSASTDTSYLLDIMNNRTLYMLSTPMPELNRSANDTSDNASTSRGMMQDEPWLQLGIKPGCITQWTQNLRMWISQTILSRVVEKVAEVNEILERLGFPETQVGISSIERMRKVVNLSPTIPPLIPFLEACPNNQSYLVQRLKELSTGGCISSFEWNGGGELSGVPWSDLLPTDSQLVMHMLSSYFDACLPVPSLPDCRPFSSKYVLKSSDKPPQGSKQGVYIVQNDTKPPYYHLIVGEDVVHVPKGSNNLFHTILLFIHHLKTKENGMVGRMNLGPSGINILACLEATTLVKTYFHS